MFNFVHKYLNENRKRENAHELFIRESIKKSSSNGRFSIHLNKLCIKIIQPAVVVYEKKSISTK